MLLNVRTVLQITFLEFFEALLACAEVKNTHEVGTAQHRRCESSYSDQTSSRDQMKNTPDLHTLASPQVSANVQEMLCLSQRHFSVQKRGIYNADNPSFRVNIDSV